MTEPQVEGGSPEAVEVLGEGEALNDVIEAEIVAETPAEPPVVLTEEEQELSAIYGEEVASGTTTAHGEFSDQKTRDEDRPMMPEINAREERKAQWQDRRDRRKQRREARPPRREGRGQGGQQIDRRGIGERRVGGEAKDLVAGILFAPRELSPDAEQELERAGRSISVMCGDLLVAALIATGVGVVSAAAPVHYLDDQLLDELLAGC